MFNYFALELIYVKTYLKIYTVVDIQGVRVYVKSFLNFGWALPPKREEN